MELSPFSELQESSQKETDRTFKPCNFDSIYRKNFEKLNECKLCWKPFDSNSEMYFINDSEKCGHKFNKECIKDYINEKCLKILAFRIKCPVSRCLNRISLESGLKVLENCDDVFRFEWNLYLNNKIHKHNKQAKLIKFDVHDCTCSVNQIWKYEVSEL